jgi:hypothetical protein
MAEMAAKLGNEPFLRTAIAFAERVDIIEFGQDFSGSFRKFLPA